MIGRATHHGQFLTATISPSNPSDTYATGGSKSKTFTAVPQFGTPPYTYAWTRDPVLGSFSDATVVAPSYSRNFTQVSGEEMIYEVDIAVVVTDAVGSTAAAVATWTVTIQAG